MNNKYREYQLLPGELCGGGSRKTLSHMTVIGNFFFPQVMEDFQEKYGGALKTQDIRSDARKVRVWGGALARRNLLGLLKQCVVLRSNLDNSKVKLVTCLSGLARASPLYGSGCHLPCPHLVSCLFAEL